ncbi:FAD-binding protein [Simkania negevensis]|uniref:FAD-binding protein n=1 Tax=Simkania negevensis TaxID=83561 RepID=A0ABS3ATU1_9BACT|nr:FAD-binding protein [Simkania negevensis]
MDTIIQELHNRIKGDVYSDPFSRSVYSIDASIYECEPLAVVQPKDKQDVLAAIEVAVKHHTPIVPRGGGTGLTGGSLGKGIVIDCSKYFNRILEINIDARYIRCEPGVTLDNLNKAITREGYQFGPDVTTSNRATLGGMFSNDASGAHSLHYGKTSDHTICVELALADTTLIKTETFDKASWAEKKEGNSQISTICASLEKIALQHRKAITEHFPSFPRRVSGYNVDELLKLPHLNLTRLIAGSEGTLGFLTELTLKIVPKPAHLGLVLLYPHQLTDALNKIPEILTYSPYALEVSDKQIIQAGKASPLLHNKLDFLSHDSDGLLIVEFKGDTADEVEQKQRHFAASFARSSSMPISCITEAVEMSNVWMLRKQGVGLLMSRRASDKAIAFIEDLSVPPEHLGHFVSEIQRYLQEKGKRCGLHGHAGEGCIHIRPYMNLECAEDFDLMFTMMNDITSIVKEYGGSLSGEHGDGIIRSWLNEKLFNKELVQVFCDIKETFDPHRLMNPGKIAYPSNPRENLRSYPGMKHVPIVSELNFDEEGGLDFAANMCNGNAFCRKSDGLMCPSFQVTLDERHSTRARAQGFRALVNGRIDIKLLGSKELYEIMDLCLQCKGCKTECPSHVDIAKMKAEFLYHYHKVHGVSIRDKIFASIGKLSRFNAAFPSLFNALVNTPLSKALLAKLGIAPERTMPLVAKKRFSKHVKHLIAQRDEEVDLLLFIDTFTEFNHPEIGIAALDVFSKLNIKAAILPWQCCGRPAISKGLLKQARDSARKIIAQLYPYAKKGIPIVGLEPSCILAIKDDYKGLLPNEQTTLVAQQCQTFDEYIATPLDKKRYPTKREENQPALLLHTHCHQKALVGSEETHKAIKCVTTTPCSEIPSGCCGMAGSFGYEKEHYAISMAIGEQKLFPAIRQCDERTIIIANGTSCREQIAHGTKRRPLHLAEYLSNTM